MKKLQSALFWIVCMTFLISTHAFGSQVIEHIPPSGIVLNEPGTYIFKNNITWNPTSDSAAITIRANNVILDMKSFTLKSAHTSFKTIGILAQTSNDLQIMDGTIRNMGPNSSIISTRRATQQLASSLSCRRISRLKTVTFPILPDAVMMLMA